MTELHQDEWNEQRLAAENAVLLDVRTEDEFNEKHLVGATLIDIRQPQSFMDAANDFHDFSNKIDSYNCTLNL